MSTPKSMFLSRNKKNNVYPRKPQFYYIKVGFKVVKIMFSWCNIYHEYRFSLRALFLVLDLYVFPLTCFYLTLSAPSDYICRLLCFLNKLSTGKKFTCNAERLNVIMSRLIWIYADCKSLLLSPLSLSFSLSLSLSVRAQRFIFLRGVFISKYGIFSFMRSFGGIYLFAYRMIY